MHQAGYGRHQQVYGGALSDFSERTPFRAPRQDVAWYSAMVISLTVSPGVRHGVRLIL